MKENMYHWNKNALLKKYFKLFFESLTCLSNLNIKQYKKIKLYMLTIKDMFFPYSIFSYYFKETQLKKQLKTDHTLVKYKLNNFQKDNIQKILNYFLNNSISLSCFEDKESDANYVYLSLLFLKQVDNTFFNELESSIKNNHMFVDNDNKCDDLDGEFFHVEDENYYYVTDQSNSKTFLTINHEIAHGVVANITNGKYDDDNDVFLYSEVLSILIEIYSNNYLYENNLITHEEYVNNYNEVILTNVYDSIEIIDVLYKSAMYESSIDELKKLINKMKQNNLNYDISLPEIIETSLSFNLTYLYSACVAMAIYQNNKNNVKAGINDALYLMGNVNYYNEEELFKTLKIDLQNGIKAYSDRNNELIRNSKIINKH